MWRNSNSPHAVGLMDLPFKQRQIRKIWLKKAGQMAGSEAFRNIIGCVAEQEPDPVLMVLPDENAAKKIMRRRILPLFEDTPCLAELKTDASRDKALTGIYLKNGFELGVGWSGSPTTQASDPVRFVGNDEVDKFAAWTGKEADPISLGDVRTATYENSLVYNISTPTTRLGLINQGWENAPIKLWFFVPCPHCERFQRLNFDRLEWDHHDEKDPRKRAALIELSRAAWYRCRYCQQKILDPQKPRMCNAGYWGTDDGGYKLFVDGREEGQLPPGSEVGMHISTLYSLAAKHKFYLIAAEWCKCQGDPMKTQNFRNSWLGEVFEELITKIQPGVIRERALNAGPPLIVPAWASALYATADTQKDHFYFVIRAWGYAYRSQLVHYGRAMTFDELYRVCLQSAFRTDDGQQATPQFLMLDSGGTTSATDPETSRTQEVYQFSMRDLARIYPAKGRDKAPKPWSITKIGDDGVTLRVLDAGYYKDMLSRLLSTEDDDPTGKKPIWMPHNQVGDDYCSQMASEHKIIDRKRGNRLVWVPITSGAANHYWDAEVLQCAAAEMNQVALFDPTLLPKPTVVAEEKPASFGPSKRW